MSTLCPGGVETEFFVANGPQPVQRVMPKSLWESAESVARYGIEGLAENRRVVIPGARMRAMMTVGKLAPAGMRLRSTDRFAQLRGR